MDGKTQLTGILPILNNFDSSLPALAQNNTNVTLVSFNLDANAAPQEFNILRNWFQNRYPNANVVVSSEPGGSVYVEATPIDPAIFLQNPTQSSTPVQTPTLKKN